MAACDTCGPVLEAPVAEARAWVGIGLGQTRRRGGGLLSGALARLVGSETLSGWDAQHRGPRHVKKS